MPADLQIIGCACLNMRAPLPITDPSSLRSTTASPKTLLLKSSSHNKNSAWGFSPCVFKHPQLCILLMFGILLCGSFMFALCTVEGSTKLAAGKRNPQERRLLGYQGNTHTQEPGLGSLATSPSHAPVKNTSANATHMNSSAEAALHGLGTVYMKGTKSMPNLIIANLEESCDMLDFRLFLRTLYKSGTMSRADLVLLFPWSSLPASVSDVLKDEGDSFNKLHAKNFERAAHSGREKKGLGDFEDILERKIGNSTSLERRRGKVFWGANHTSLESEEQTNFYDPDYGSVVGFYMGDLDSTDAFWEFLNNPSSQLRRWLCYQMLLGLLRFKFRLVMLVELGGVVISGDVFADIKRKEFLHLTLQDSTWADAITESNHVSFRQSSSISGLQQAIKSVMGNKNMFDAINSKATTKRKTTHKEQTRHARVRERNINLLAGGRADDPPVLHDKGKDASAGENEAAMESAQDVVKYRRPKEGLMEMVYGREVWNSLEQVEKQRRVIGSRVILGSMRSAKGLASSMVVEIVRVALQRKSKLSFPDRALLSYLVQKSPYLLGRRVTENLRVMENSNSMIHSVENLKPDNVLVRSQDWQRYTVLHASSLNTRRTAGAFEDQETESIQSNVTWSQLILANICASTTNSSAFYRDCDWGQAYTYPRQ